jgi:hypothetical protein
VNISIINSFSDGANAIYEVRNAFWYRPTNYNVSKSLLNQLLRLFIRSGCDINSTALSGSSLHFTVSKSVPGLDIIQEAEITTLVNLIICLGGDIEYKNADGLTPLLHNACLSGYHGVIVLGELLQWGADPHAKTLLGEGALHLAIAFSVSIPDHSAIEMNSLRDRLGILLQAGCDPTLEDSNGHTPSDFALSSPRTWFQWCFAIEKIKNLSMVQILDQETPFGLYNHVKSTEETTELGQCQPVEDNKSFDWEYCSDSEDERSELKDNKSSATCSHPGHIFISWNDKFPWSIDPSCTDCGQPCGFQDTHRRKWAAWSIFQGLVSQMAPSIN